MATPTIADMLKYANLQMAAEALYGFDATVNPSWTPGTPAGGSSLSVANLTEPKGSETFRFLNQATDHAPPPPRSSR